MRSTRFASSSPSVLAFALLLISSAAAQSNPVVFANQRNAISDAQELPAGAGAQLAHAAQVPPIKFGRAVFLYMEMIPYSVALADLNGDGKLDIVTAGTQNYNNYDGEVAVRLGNGDGTFGASVGYSSGGCWAMSVAVGDVNGDGYPDLVVANEGYCTGNGDGEVSVLLGNGDGTFQLAVGYDSGGEGAASVVIADVNSDGKPDLIVANGCLGTNCANGSVAVLLGNGDGTFQPAVLYDSGGNRAVSVAVGDLNGDGKPDLVVANQCQAGGSLRTGPLSLCNDGFATVSVLLGNGDGTFQPAVPYSWTGDGAASVAIADVNGDGNPDLVVAVQYYDHRSTIGEVSVLLGNGDGTFQAATSYKSGGIQATSVAIGDFNDDGYPDLAVTNMCKSTDQWDDCLGPGTVGVLLGNGDGTFLAPKTYGTVALSAASVAVGDLTGDGQSDLVVADEYSAYTSGVGVLLNEFTFTTTKLTSSPNPSLTNQTVTFTATITSIKPIPDGEVVTFYSGKTEIGTGMTASGVATLNTSFSTAGKYTIKASYPGDAFHKPSFGKVVQVVNQ